MSLRECARGKGDNRGSVSDSLQNGLYSRQRRGQQFLRTVKDKHE